MPRCVYAIARRQKHPLGLPAAHRLWLERSEALRAYGEAAENADFSISFPLLPFGASTETVRQHTQWLLKHQKSVAQAEPLRGVAPRATSIWDSIFGRS